MNQAAAAEIHPPARMLRQRLPEATLLFIVAGLSLLGMATLFSIGRAYQPESTVYLFKQGVWLLCATVALVVTMRLRLEKIRKLSWFFGFVSVVFLALVLVPSLSREINGARRWLSLGPVNMQVSDFAKIGFIFVLAHYLSLQQRHLKEFWKGFVYPMAIIGVVCLFLMEQPDFGTTVLFGAVGGTLLFLSGVRISFLIPVALLGVALFAFAVWQDPVRLDRITSYLHPEANRGDGSYQLWQGRVAFGSGGVEGVGLGNGRQALSFLPEAHTDFIFAVIGEELGLIATGLVVLAFTVFFVVVASELRKARNLFEFNLVTGALLFVSLQSLINLGVVTGLLPTKGMSLPFISYGGSNLVVLFILVGLILNYLSEWNSEVRREAREIHG